MDDAQHAVAELNLVFKEIRCELQHARDRGEQTTTGEIERIEHLDARLAKPRDRVDPNVVGHVVAVRVALGQFSADMPELLQVEVRRALGGFDTEGGVAACAAAALEMKAVLLGFRPGEERLELVEKPVDEFLRDAVVLDDHEPVVFVGFTNGRDELRGLDVAETQGRYVGRHSRILHPLGCSR